MMEEVTPPYLYLWGVLSQVHTIHTTHTYHIHAIKASQRERERILLLLGRLLVGHLLLKVLLDQVVQPEALAALHVLQR